MNCYICECKDFSNSNQFKTLPRVTSDAKPFKKGGNIGYCLQCGFIQKNLDSLMEQELEEIYSHYTPYHQSKNDTQIIFTQEGPISRCEFLLKRIRSLLHTNHLKSVLDFGCGSCSFLKEAHREYPKMDLYGFDLDDRNAVTVASLKSFKRFFSGDYKDIDRKFSLISLIHSLEHIPDPKSVLSFVRDNLLEEEGHLFIQVPNVAKNPFDLLVADHLSHFTPISLENLLKKSGFQIVNTTYDWIDKEISFLVTKSNNASVDISPDFSFSQMLEKEIDQFHSIIREAQEVLRTKKDAPFGIFGTSIASTWLATALNEKIDFFVDEDLNRVGGTHLEKPILNPSMVISGKIYIPFPKEPAEKIYKKCIEKKWDFEAVFPGKEI